MSETHDPNYPAKKSLYEMHQDRLYVRRLARQEDKPKVSHTDSLLASAPIKKLFNAFSALLARLSE